MYKRKWTKQVAVILLALVMALGNAMVVRAAYYGDDEIYNYPEYEVYTPDEYFPELEVETEDEYEVGEEYEEGYECDAYEAIEVVYAAITPVSAQLFSGGDGVNIPFMIANSADLMAFSEFTSGMEAHPYLSIDFFNRAYYVLVADIDMANYFNFLPIGFQQHNAFNGSFNGNEFTIYNLLINFDWVLIPLNASINSLGMFGFIHNADIHNVNLVNPEVVVTGHSRDNIGFLIGTAVNSRVSNINIEGGSINARQAHNVGGVVGIATNTPFNDITVTGSSILGIDNVGGVAGQITSGRITTATVNVDVQGRNNVGGIAGLMEATTISDSGLTNDATVRGTNAIGGVVGRASGLFHVFNSFGRANVTGNNNVGGIVGHIHSTASGSTLTNSYATGVIRGNDSVGGLIGLFDSGANGLVFDITNNYSHATVYANTRAGGLAGQLHFRYSIPGSSSIRWTTVNVHRNYVSVNITVTNNFAGGLIGDVSRLSGRGTINAAITNNFIIADIIAPSAAAAVSIVGNGTQLSPSNNFYSFASRIHGGAIGDFSQAVRVHQQAITLPTWWTSTLLIGNAFNVDVIRNGELPLLRKRNSAEYVRFQESIDFAGNIEPELCGSRYWHHVRNSGENLVVEFNTFGGATVRDIPGLRNPQDYIVIGETIMFRSEFLDLLPAGTFPFRVNFTSGHTIIVSISIYDATPEAPRLLTYFMDFAPMDFFFGLVSHVDIGVCSADIARLGINIYATTFTVHSGAFDMIGLLQPANASAEYRIFRITAPGQLLHVFETQLVGSTGSLQFNFSNESTSSMMFRMV
ncbi:MAG: hypothetical protein FWC16_07230 [Defluviitaleaceae bacterium]|nr:hypothetical protein [Defluviitaleaceae bacterium]MCL2274705.1 hypothetical protein [Defluviitaleaceae bacterium]